MKMKAIFNKTNLKESCHVLLKETKVPIILSFVFLIAGIFLMNLRLQIMGIIIILFLIYNHLFNSEQREEYKKKSFQHVKGYHFLSFLGKIDLTLGLLLILSIEYSIIPSFVIFFFAIMLFFKALPFVFFADVLSIIDLVFSIIIFYSLTIEFSPAIMFGISFYLIIKGVLSLFE